MASSKPFLSISQNANGRFSRPLYLITSVRPDKIQFQALLINIKSFFAATWLDLITLGVIGAIAAAVSKTTCSRFPHSCRPRPGYRLILSPGCFPSPPLMEQYTGQNWLIHTWSLYIHLPLLVHFPRQFLLLSSCWRNYGYDPLSTSHLLCSDWLTA